MINAQTTAERLSEIDSLLEEISENGLAEIGPGRAIAITLDNETMVRFFLSEDSELSIDEALMRGSSQSERVSIELIIARMQCSKTFELIEADINLDAFQSFVESIYDGSLNPVEVYPN